jgi:nucleoside-diphosphate-sugar epimerase
MNARAPTRTFTRTCAVAGANGFIGQAACRRFQAEGWRVVALVRRPGSAPQGCEERVFALGEPLNSALLSGVDVLLHAAYDFAPRSWADICRLNVLGSEYLFDAATRAGIKRQIFISSMAAFEGCRSKYGLGKLAAEHAVQIRGGCVIRPGFTYGEQNGGLAAKVVAAAKALPIVPMIGSGRYPLYTCHIDDLSALIVHLAGAEPWVGELFTAANALPVTLRGLVEQAKTPAAPPPVVPIPWRLVAASLWLAEVIGLRLGFRSDNVVSIVHANTAPDFTPLARVPVSFRPFAQPR